MPDQTEMTKAVLLDRVQRGWDSLQAFVASLTPEQLTVPTDAAGWTVKDHLMHLAVWEDGADAVLCRENRRERMGVSPEVWHPETWHTAGFDDLNAAIRERHKDKPLSDVLQTHADVHQRFVSRIQALSDADIVRPMREFNPESTSETPVYQLVIGDTYGHYAEHLPWMDAIANGENHEIISKIDLLSRVEKGWNDLMAYLEPLTYEQVTIPTDPAGWTAKDHLVHLAVWEDSLNALFDRVPRWQHMGVDRDLWESANWDKVNAIIQQRYKDISLRDLQGMFFGIHERLVARLKSLWDSDLQLPYNTYQPDSTITRPALHWVVIDTYEHYDEHKDYITVIVAGNENATMSKAVLLAEIEKGWNKLNAYLDSLTDEQRTRKTDAADWTIKDHAIHLAMWENGIYALLEHLSRPQYMGIDDQTWENGDNDHINAIIRERHKDRTWQEIQQDRHRLHQRLVDKIQSLTDADLYRPYRDYDPASPRVEPVINWINGNTFGHYDEHLPWMRAIAGDA